METVICVLGRTQIEPQFLDMQADWVGIDYGAFLCASQQIKMTMAIGDFDSVADHEFEMIQMACEQLVKLNPIKDDSDFEAALNYLNDYQKIIVLGSWGGRFDHAYVNLKLVEKDSRILFYDEHNKVQCLNPGVYELAKENYTYLSVFAKHEAIISISGVKYPLNRVNLTDKDLYTLSNEITQDKARLEIHEGQLLVIWSKD